MKGRPLLALPGGSHAPDTHRGETQHRTPGCTQAPRSPGGRRMGSPGPLLPPNPPRGSAGLLSWVGAHGRLECSRRPVVEPKPRPWQGSRTEALVLRGPCPRAGRRARWPGERGKSLADRSLRQKQLQTAALRPAPWRPLAADAAGCPGRDLGVWPRCQQPRPPAASPCGSPRPSGSPPGGQSACLAGCPWGLPPSPGQVGSTARAPVGSWLGSSCRMGLSTPGPGPALGGDSAPGPGVSLSGVRLSATPWTAAHQAPLSMGFCRQRCRSGLPFPPPGDLPDPGIKPGSPALQADSLPTELPGLGDVCNPGVTQGVC